MRDAHIVFDHVWMKFHRGETHDSLRDLIPALGRRLVGRAPNPRELEAQDFWAVRDLSFEVKPGQVLGIIGANGSGKSTTLRILTKILEATRGHCEIHGRVGALIEVSAGFHGDLTGRENVFLQGAIMGLRVREIAERFDRIVEFSGIEEFIDTPVKRYSSGMNARLGFSIAAHLEPDVLIIDEVLAVGDFMFQERAFGRIKELARSGIPVVIVSHQLDRVADLCTSAILLDRGSPRFVGSPADAIAAYVQPSESLEGAASSSPVTYRRITLVGPDNVVAGDTVRVRIEGQVHRPIPASVDPLVFRLRSLESTRVLFISGLRHLQLDLPEGETFVAEIDLQMNVSPGRFLLEPAVYDVVAQHNHLRGQPVLIEVRDRGTSIGSVQLNPRVRFVETHG